MKKLRLITLLISLTALFVVAPMAVAQTTKAPLQDACDNITDQTQRPAICDTPATDPLTGSGGLLLKVANIIAMVTGVIAVFIIIIAGLQYITSAGEPNKISSARQAIIFACVGLVVILIARTLIAFIIRRL